MRGHTGQPSGGAGCRLKTSDGAVQACNAFALGRDVARNFFLVHHPILGFEPNPAQNATSLYPGTQALQSVLPPIDGRQLFLANVEALLSGHNHLFEMVSFATSQPAQLILGNGGAWAAAPLPVGLARTTQPAPEAVIESVVSTSKFGFVAMERGTVGEVAH